MSGSERPGPSREVGKGERQGKSRPAHQRDYFFLSPRGEDKGEGDINFNLRA